MFTELKHNATQFMDVALSASRLTYASIAVGLVFLFLFFRIMFRAPGSFEYDLENSRKRCLFEGEYWKRMFDGNNVDRQWSKLKIFVWLALSAAGGWSAYHKLPELFPIFFR